ncbi:DUF6113 family protein [Streptomyces sp. NBC_00102]|uniref:DUF6113 family protein n=1 Tax=Streptomyces sp. NBC_00102 TaxID=2975652 RepID=UPI00224DD112|nr:DUF6113 family protein [Streptomyces sp. NBC_00102]MCX5399500.1 DUF6113 family protein [Streptomyces sp. NBC_00102]
MSGRKSRDDRARAEARAPRTNAPPRAPEPTGMAAPLNPRRIGAYLGLAVLGALVQLAGSLVQGAWFPGGLLLALAGGAGVFYGGRLLTRTQLGALAPAAGWLVALFVVLAGRPEGDALFGGGDEIALALFALGGMVVAVICATFSGGPLSANDQERSGR